MNRAHSQLEIRSVDEEHRIVEGIANTAAVDTHGTIIEPAGAVYSLPLPFHWHHKREAPVGEVIDTELREGKRWVKIQIAHITDDGTEGGREVKRRVDGAWADLKHGLVRGLSVEFAPIEPKSHTAKRWTKWRWLGLAGVTIPSNSEATITAIRAADAAYESPGVTGTHSSPGVSGTNQNNQREKRRPMTIQEQIAQHENSRAAKVARRDAILATCGAEGRTFDESEREEYNGLEAEVRSIDEYLVALNAQARDAKAAAVPVTATTTEAAAQTRGGVPVVKVRDNVDKGIHFARYVMALVKCQGNGYQAADYVKRTWGDGNDEVAELLRNPELMTRAAVAAGTTTAVGWAKELVPTTPLNDFLELLRPRTLIGRIPGLRNVPFNISMPAQTAGGTYGWVGEGSSTAVTRPTYASVTLGMSKASGIIVLTEELVRSSAPAAQEATRDELLSGIQAFLDGQLVTPTVAPVANVSPGAITNGIPAGDTRAATGTTEAAARADLRWLLSGFVTGNFSLAGTVLLMSENVAFTIGTMINAVGEPAFPGVTALGGNLLGIPVVTSNTLGTTIVAVHAPSILIADEGGTEIDISREASLIMDDAPNSVVQAAGAAPIHTSLFQKHMVALRVLRFINWGRARTGSVRTVTGVAYA